MGRRSDLGGRYFVSPRYQFNKVLAESITPDEAAHLARSLSGKKEHFGTIFMAWNAHEATGKPVVRAVGHAGKCWWAVTCPKVDGSGWCPDFCDACGGLALVPR